MAFKNKVENCVRRLVAVALLIIPINVLAAEQSVTLSVETLKDKIKGAWAAQTIGVTYGFPVEFRFNSTLVPDDHELPWYDGYLFETMDEIPGVYDDIYMDLTFVQVFEDEGIDAPTQSFADAFANADYSLWFANQVARYNVLDGHSPPQSGHWLNNPAADDIDFQIEADFAGIMSPGMVNSAVEISDRVGHIMNYGDGWYGGVFIASMYSLAFVNDDIEGIVREALEVIPAQSDFYKIIADVLAFHDENPDDWKFAWQGIHDKWSDTDLGPRGLLSPFNIDAKINAAWVVLGLLYGDGDFARTMEIATRAGDDADCNPASAAGILGTINGYSGIPDFWKQGLAEVEAMDFAYTTISLNDAYDMSYRHALELIQRGGGSVNGDNITIQLQNAETVPFEDSFENHFPKERRVFAANSNSGDEVELTDTFSFDFEGIGFALLGTASTDNDRDYNFEADIYINGKLSETVSWPTKFTKRRFYLAWKFALADQAHNVEVRLRNPTDSAKVVLDGVVIYDNEILAGNQL